ncbi:MAG TPA: tRNA dihydrouridine(20/20a) synthase DusA [Steroidobacteraceae bacterium]|nr:tRNA dihydrouridine(20/20a) synthase DusA [Steroidobacteraceae bacterium]
MSLLPDRRLCVAPMLDYTDRHCRYFLRGFSPRALLYTEMITTEAILRGDAERLLQHSPAEHPVALQLGGGDPVRLASAARIGAEAGYDEINLNCGCPSERVNAGSFGACLMREPARVAECVAAMIEAVDVPVTVKMRIGVVAGGARAAREQIGAFDADDHESLAGFVAAVSAAGCGTLIVHARKAVLGGLSPKENRNVPPLHYDVVRWLKQEFPAIEIILNGGLRATAQVLESLDWCDGVMLGREAYHRPWALAELHQAIYPDDGWQAPEAEAVLARMADYAAAQLLRGESLSAVVRHLLGLQNGRPGARRFRQHLAEGARQPGAGPELIRSALRVAAAEPESQELLRAEAARNATLFAETA